MKKLALTIAIVLGLGFGAFAQHFNHQGGMFQRGAEPRERGGEIYAPLLLPEHGVTDNQSAVPVGSGIAVVTALGAAYLVGKKRKKE